LQNKYQNITIALGGLVQAVSLVRDIAQTGKQDTNAFSTSIQSIFTTDPKNPIDVYGEMKNIQFGLERLTTILNPVTESSKMTVRYMLSLMRIQKKISHAPRILHLLSDRIRQTKKQVEYFTLTHPTVISNLADTYLHVIAPFRYRFFVLGNQQILTVHENMEKIRALLLAAIRASVLWRQMGGSRLQFIFSRAKIKTNALDMLKQCNCNS